MRYGDSWQAVGDGEHYLLRVVLPSGEHIEYDLPHMPVSKITEGGAQFWWEYHEHVYSLALPASYPLEIVAPRRFQDDEILKLIREAKEQTETS